MYIYTSIIEVESSTRDDSEGYLYRVRNLPGLALQFVLCVHNIPQVILGCELYGNIRFPSLSQPLVALFHSNFLEPSPHPLHLGNTIFNTPI